MRSGIDCIELLVLFTVGRSPTRKTADDSSFDVRRSSCSTLKEAGLIVIFGIACLTSIPLQRCYHGAEQLGDIQVD